MPSSEPRPSTATSLQTRLRCVASAAVHAMPLVHHMRPVSAAPAATSSPSPSTSQLKSTSVYANANAVGASSDDLIRDLEAKVRQVVALKRAESDRLRFAVTQKREDVEKAKLQLQDLLVQSEALGLQYDLTSDTNSEDRSAAMPPRLQTIATISRRPLYVQHTTIHDLELKLQVRAQEAQDVRRRMLVLEHIHKRLLRERSELAAAITHRKQCYSDLTHQTSELQQKEIAAQEAVNHAQTRVAQQRAEMAMSERKFRRELALRHKWAKEKAKFERYYDAQLQSVQDKQQQAAAVANAIATPSVKPSPSARTAVPAVSTTADEQAALDDEERCRVAFQRIGVDQRATAIDPEEIVRIYQAHEQLRDELDAKHAAALRRITELRAQIDKARSIAREEIPLSTRGTSQHIETQELQVSAVERALAVVADQYLFVDQAVRPLKIGLQQILHTVSNETIDIDDMDALERALLGTCEEMMRMLRDVNAVNGNASGMPVDAQGDSEYVEQGEEGEQGENAMDQGEGADAAATVGELEDDPALLSVDALTSQFNVRVPAKERAAYYVAGLNTPPHKDPDEESDDPDDVFEVMDRATVKRVASVLVCTSTSASRKASRKSHDDASASAKA